MKKDLLSIHDLDRDDIGILFQQAGKLKRMQREGKAHQPLKGKTLGMIFLFGLCPELDRCHCHKRL